jgi:hypothetical protein
VAPVLRIVWCGHFCPQLPAPFANQTGATKRSAQALANLLNGHSRHPNYFIPAAQSGRNGNGTLPHLQKFCEEFDAGLVGPAISWRRGEGDLQRIANLSSDCIFLSAGMNSDGEGNTAGRFMHWDHRVFSDWRAKKIG